MHSSIIFALFLFVFQVFSQENTTATPEQICFTGSIPCGKSCCPTTLTPNNPTFCADPAISLCCPVGTTNIKGLCCPSGTTNSLGKCCPLGTTNSLGICCPPGQHNSGGHCCPIGRVGVGGICCLPGQINRGDRCECPVGFTQCGLTCCKGVCNFRRFRRGAEAIVCPEGTDDSLCGPPRLICLPQITASATAV